MKKGGKFRDYLDDTHSRIRLKKKADDYDDYISAVKAVKKTKKLHSLDEVEKKLGL